MSVTVERALDEPIVRFVFSGAFDAVTVTEANTHAQQLLDSLGVFYAILDLTSISESPQQVIDALRRASASNMIKSNRIHPILVNRQAITDGTIPSFTDDRAAVTYIRRTIADSPPE